MVEEAAPDDTWTTIKGCSLLPHSDITGFEENLITQHLIIARYVSLPWPLFLSTCVAVKQ